MIEETYFVLETSKDKKGKSYYFIPPDFQNYKMNPCRYHYYQLEDDVLLFNFDDSYQVKIKEHQLTADFYIRSDLASKDFIMLLNQLDVDHRSIPLDIMLHCNKKPKKQYFLTFVTDRISIIDQDQSDYQVNIDKYTNEPVIEKGFASYEKISKFIIDKVKVNQRHLFYCVDIHGLVCSSYFKNKYIEHNLMGVDFVEINSEFIYDHLAGLI